MPTPPLPAAAHPPPRILFAGNMHMPIHSWFRDSAGFSASSLSRRDSGGGSSWSCASETRGGKHHVPFEEGILWVEA